MNDLGPVLITGASSGISAATAARLTRAGHTVYATARKADTLTQLADAGAQTRSLDVTDDASMRAVVDEIVEAHGRVGGLANNAGYGTYGAVEDVPMEAARAQFETNVFGVRDLLRLFDALQRAQSTSSSRTSRSGNFGR